MAKKYASLSTLQTFLSNLKTTFASKTHTHKLADVTDYKVDSALSSTSTNPVQNKVLDAEFDAISDTMGALEVAIGGKAESTHYHDDRYYTETEIDSKLSEKASTSHNHDAAYDTKGSASAVQTNLNVISDELDAHTSDTNIHVTTTNKSNWNTAYTHSQSAHARTDATKVADSTTNGNILINGSETNVYTHPNSGVTAGTYKSVTVNAQGHVTGGTNPTTLAGYGITDAETKGAASSALASAKEYTDSVASGKSNTNHNHDTAYDAKGSASSALASAKSYADSAATTAATKVKNDLLNGAGGAYDTLKELGDLIDDNADAIDALETVAAGKADKSHTHAIADVSGLQSALDGKAASSHGTHVSYSTTAPVMDGTASVGTASTVARSDHKHPTDTSRASKTEFDSHTANTTAHITSTERSNWNAAKTHADSAHAPSNAEKNQNAFSNVKVGSTTIAADSATDTLELVGNNVTITPDATNDKVTISVSDGSTSTKGVVQLTNSTSSTSTTTAATPSSVKSAYDLANQAKTAADTAQSTADGKADSSHTHNYAGSSSAGGAATSANKVNSSLTVKLNGGTTEGTNLFTFNGSAAKAVNITPSAIGAATSSHTHDDRYYTETEIDTKLSGKANTSHGNHVPTTQTASNKVFLRNDNTWATVTPANIGAASSSHTHTVANISDLTATATELNYMDGVTSNVQTQLDAKQTTITGGASTITGSNLTANRALISDGSGKVAVSAVTSTELGYLDGVTSAIQTQLDGKAKRVSLNSQCQVTSYRTSVIALCKAPTDATCGGATNSYSAGTLSFSRYNGLYAPTVAIISMCSSHGAVNKVLARYINSSGFQTFKPCTFKYNNVVYGGIEVKTQNAEAPFVTFSGETTFEIFGLDIYDSNTKTVLNEEVYNSISYDNVTVTKGWGDGGNEIITSASIGSQSVNYATSAGSATSATKATQDGSGNVITSIYATKTELDTALDGKVNKIISTSADLNTLTTSGFYRLSNSNANMPSGGAHGQLIVSRGGDTITQIVGSYSNGTLYTRSGNSSYVGGPGKWTAWKTIIDSSTIGSQSVNYATSADSATKATQDASGNTITSTYATKTELNTAKTNLQASIDGKAASSHNHAATNITSGTLSYDRLPTVPITKGGTGATTAAAALTNLGITATASELNKLDGVTVSTTELNYLNGVTSNIQSQLIDKADKSHTHTVSKISDLTATAAELNIMDGVTATTTEINYLSGVTSNIQLQLFYHAGKKVLTDDNCYTGEIFNDNDNIASGCYSHAEGHQAIAYGNSSHAEGYYTTASGNYSHAEGGGTNADGTYSHAEGDDTTASGNSSHAEGGGTTASGNSSHAEGGGTWADGTYSHAEGHGTTADGLASHAEGYYTTASGNYSHAGGCHTTSLASQYAIGHYNNTTTATAGNTSGTGTGTAFVIGNGTASTAANAFRVTYAGQVYANSSITSTGRDYAEFFEWQDSNPNVEDRRGYFVTLDGGKIKIAEPNDYILGIVSGQPAVLGNGDEDWRGRYILDEFGALITEEFEYEEEIHEEVFNEETGETTIETKIVTKTGTRYKENPDYDPSIPYVQRADRPEWDYIGMLGVLSVRDDGTCQVNGYCKVAEGGIATASETGYRVINRINDDIVEVVFR